MALFDNVSYKDIERMEKEAIAIKNRKAFIIKIVTKKKGKKKGKK
jgi:hypothetical protein